MNRCANCIQMLLLLHARGFMRKEELADELGVNLRNIVEYRKELEAAGYTIMTTTGKYGGYTLERGTLLPVQGFTTKQKKALQEALVYLKEHPDFYMIEDFQSAMDKIQASSAMPHSSAGFYLNDTKAIVSKQVQEMIQLCEQARQEHRVIDMEYKSMHAKTFQQIRIHPYEILNYKGSYYCLAYSLKAKDYRHYKFSEERMRFVTMNELTFNRDMDFNIKDHVGNLGLIQDAVYELELELYEETALLMSEKQVGLHPVIQWISEDTLHYSTIMEGKMEVISFLLSLGKQCKVIKPQSIRIEIEEILHDMLGNYHFSE